MKTKEIIKLFLYRYGFVKNYHKLRNKNALTVLMFHRILPKTKAKSLGANGEWTLSPEQFDELLGFLSENYNIISYETLLDSLKAGSKLPATSLLITFDDGWQDNYEYALPLLKKYNLPAVIFVVSDVLDKISLFWQEIIFSCCKLFPETLEEINRFFDPKLNFQNSTQLIEYLDKQVDETLKLKIVNCCQRYIPNERQLLNIQEIKELSRSGVTIGAHGQTHKKLGDLIYREQLSELTEAKSVLSTISTNYIGSISFPHGSYNEETKQICNQLDYKIMFSSRAIINQSISSFLGRIHVSSRNICIRNQFDELTASYNLFFREKN